MLPEVLQKRHHMPANGLKKAFREKESRFLLVPSNLRTIMGRGGHEKQSEGLLNPQKKPRQTDKSKGHRNTMGGRGGRLIFKGKKSHSFCEERRVCSGWGGRSCSKRLRGSLFQGTSEEGKNHRSEKEGKVTDFLGTPLERGPRKDTLREGKKGAPFHKEISISRGECLGSLRNPLRRFLSTPKEGD